jgi:CBS domain-containing protein
VQQFSRGTRVEIYCGETDKVGRTPAYQAILEYLRSEGAAGATVTRGIAGFGRASLIHTAAILRLSLDLPVVVTWIDAPERVERLLPRVRELAGSGVITVEDVGVASYGERAVGKMRFDLQVRDVMTSDVRSITLDATTREAVESLLGRPFRALPVVDAGGHVVGVVSNGDLVTRGGLAARVELLGAMTAEDRGRYLEGLPKRTIAKVMTPNPVTVLPTATLTEATRLIVARHLKRLPVAEADGTLVGILSRADILRAVAEAFPSNEPAAAGLRGERAWAAVRNGGEGGRGGKPEVNVQPGSDGKRGAAGAPQTARDVMRVDVPVVRVDAPLPQVVDVVCSTRLNRAVVVDGERRPVGTVSDAAVLRALGAAGGGLVGALMGKVGLNSESDRTAGDIMVTPARAVTTTAPLAEVALVMTEHGRKIVPVTGADGRLAGIIDRADLLRATNAALGALVVPTGGVVPDEDD